MMSTQLDDHVRAALSHLREADNELEGEMNQVWCVAQGQLRAAALAVEAAAALLDVEIPQRPVHVEVEEPSSCACDRCNPPGDLRDLGSRLLWSRASLRGWSQRELERRSGISNAYISQLETGAAEHPSISTVAALADALSVGRAWLAWGEGDAPHA